MANLDSSTAEAASAISASPLHKSFSWLSDNIKGDPNARFAAAVKNVAMGGETIAHLVRRQALNTDSGDAPLLCDFDLDNLISMLIYSLESLNDHAEARIKSLEEAACPGAKP